MNPMNPINPINAPNAMNAINDPNVSNGEHSHHHKHHRPSHHRKGRRKDAKQRLQDFGRVYWFYLLIIVLGISVAVLFVSLPDLLTSHPKHW